MVGSRYDGLPGWKAKTLLVLALFAGMDSRSGLGASEPAIPRQSLRIIVPGLKPGDEPGAAEKILMKTRELDLLEKSLAELDATTLAHSNVVLLDERSLEEIARHGDGFVEALEASVDRGTGLVVTGRAAAALPNSKRFSRLLGRRGDKQSAQSLQQGGAALRILNQRHPITECVTDLYFSRASVVRVGGDSVLSLGGILRKPASAASKTRPQTTGKGPRSVFWVRRQGRGKVAVLALEPAAGSDSSEPDREKEALSFLVARALQWVSGERAASRIPKDLPLAVEHLRPHDAGCLPGLPPEKGFYRGRQVAPVMSYHGADWLMRAEREETELPEKTLDALKIRRGSTVADLGAGAGYFSLRLAERVGPSGRVLATDVQPEMLELLRENMARKGTRNVEPILATETDPRLPEGVVDLVLLVDVYHELSRPAKVLEQIRRSLQTGTLNGMPGRLVLVEFRGEDPLVPIKPLHRTTVQQIRGEIEPAGFRFVEVKGFLPQQHILIFERGK